MVFHVTSPDEVGLGLLISLVRRRTKNMKEEEYRRIKPWFVYFENGWGIVRTGHLGVERLLDILKEIDGSDIDGEKLRVNIAGVSGTLKSGFYKHIPGMARAGKHYRNR